ncbi:trypsin-like serine protease [bacterium]|nr:trypsin-like serine protease [bacterium]
MNTKYLIFIAGLLLNLKAYSFIGGQIAQTKEFPSVLYIEDNCTVSLVGPNKILTAAHCVSNFKDSFLMQPGSKIRVYSSPIVIGSVATEVTIHKFDVHSEWVKKLNSGQYMEDFIQLPDTTDIAVITLKEDLSKLASVPVATISFAPLKVNQKVYVGGYGCEEVGVPSRDPKYKYAIKNIKSITGNIFQVTDKNSNNKLTSMGCEGDSGGPVHVLQKNKKVIIAINSSLVESEKGTEMNLLILSKFQVWLKEALKN